MRLFVILLLDLGSQVEADVTEVAVISDFVLGDKRDIGRHAESDAAGEGGGLGEEVEVAKGEGEGDFLLALDDNSLVLLVDGGVALADDVTSADVASDLELDAFLGSADLDGVADDGDLAADALELGGGHLDDALVLSVRDTEVLAIDVHKLQVEVGDAGLLGVLEHEGDVVAVVVGLKGDGVVVASALKDLGHGGKVDAKGDVAVGTEMLETFGAEEEGDEGDVGRVHGLEGDAGAGAVEVGVSDEVLHAVHELIYV